MTGKEFLRRAGRDGKLPELPEAIVVIEILEQFITDPDVLSEVRHLRGRMRLSVPNPLGGERFILVRRWNEARKHNRPI